MESEHSGEKLLWKFLEFSGSGGKPTALPQALKRIGSQALDVRAKAPTHQLSFTVLRTTKLDLRCCDAQISDSQPSGGEPNSQDWLCHKTKNLMSGVSSNSQK